MDGPLPADASKWVGKGTVRHRMSARLPLPTPFLGPLSARAFLPSWPPSHRHSLAPPTSRPGQTSPTSSSVIGVGTYHREYFSSVTMDEGEAPAPRIKGTAFVARSLTDFRVLAESLPNKPRQQDASDAMRERSGAPASSPARDAKRRPSSACIPPDDGESGSARGARLLLLSIIRWYCTQANNPPIATSDSSSPKTPG